MTTFTDPAEAGKLICGPACGFSLRSPHEPLPPVVVEDDEPGDAYAPDEPPW